MNTGRILTVVICGLLIAGCQTSSDGIDLTERGALNLTITRVSESSVSAATATVTDNNVFSLPYTNIVLSDAQILYVDDIPLTATILTALGLDSGVDATIEAVDAPGDYEISFDNDGVVTVVEIEPPEDFEDVTPESSTEVSRDGFDLEWEESDDDDVTIDITITGYTTSYADDGSLVAVAHAVSLTNLVDDGEVTIGSVQLNQFLAGSINVTVTRVKSVSQKLGFASGTINFEITLDIPLTLVESDAD